MMELAGEQDSTLGLAPHRRRRRIPDLDPMMTASLGASATLAFFILLRLASFIAQLCNAVQPLSGLVRMMLAAS
jgi:hypothetical protein